MQHHFIDQFFLICFIQFSPGMLQYVCRNFCFFIAKLLQRTDQFAAHSCVTDYSIRGTVIHLCRPHTLAVLQIVLQDIRLVVRHAFLIQMNTHSAFGLLSDPKSHNIPP